MSSSTRTESDSFGPIEVPADAYWGAQTQRSIENFPFGANERMPREIVHALGFVKQAAARRPAITRSAPARDGTRPASAIRGRRSSPRSRAAPTG